jgi:hypothetical protein
MSSRMGAERWRAQLKESPRTGSRQRRSKEEEAEPIKAMALEFSERSLEGWS